MKRILKLAAAAWMIAALSIPMLFMAFAAEEIPEVELPVTINLSGLKSSAAEDLTVVLKAENEECPMPEGSVDGIYTMTITGGGTKHLAKIPFPKVGIYRYSIWQQPGTDTRGTYDATVYEAVIYVLNKEGGEAPGLETMIAMHIGGEATKPGQIEFTNHYKQPVTNGGGDGGEGYTGAASGAGGDNVTKIDDETTPLSHLKQELTDIFDELIPTHALAKTGDDSDPALWLFFMIISAAGVIGLIIYWKRIDK
jgi:pilin isopeptide linkage protein